MLNRLIAIHSVRIEETGQSTKLGIFAHIQNVQEVSKQRFFECYYILISRLSPVYYYLKFKSDTQ
jgi:hypothetical protein